MSIRVEVAELVQAGPFPSEDASVEEIERVQRLLESISAPVSDEEAHALVAVFGPDNCYGLAWTLLHLIETAPGAKTADYPRDSENAWVKMLRSRVEFTRSHSK